MISVSFVTAGRAVFTVSNDKHEHYTYKVSKKKDQDLWFISLLTGPNNRNDYTYMGVLGDGVRITKKSKYTIDSKPVKVFNWALKVIAGAKALPNGYDIQHEGICGRCGRELTHPESISSGFGPECIKRIG